MEALLTWPHLSDALGFAALILLALPALAAASSADKTGRFLHLDLGENVDPKLRAAKRRFDDKLLKKAREWSPWHSGFLYTGYALAVVSYLVKFY